MRPVPALLEGNGGPLGPLARGLPPSDNSLSHLPQPWYERGITKQDFAWIDLETSLQWPAFQRVVEVLRGLGVV